VRGHSSSAPIGLGLDRAVAAEMPSPLAMLHHLLYAFVERVAERAAVSPSSSLHVGQCVDCVSIATVQIKKRTPSIYDAPQESAKGGVLS